MDFTYLLKSLLRKKWIIIFAMAIGFAAGLVFTLFQKKTYISDAQYSTGFTQAGKVSIQLTEIFDVNQIDLRFNNVIETFQSQIVLGMLSYELILHDLESPHPFRVLTETQKRDSAYTKIDLLKTKDILHRKLSTLTLLNTYEPEEKRVWDLINLYEYDQFGLSKKITIERLKSSDFLDVSFTSEKPELCAFVVNTIGVKFKEFYNSLTTVRTKESLVKIDSLQQIKRKQVEAYQKKLEDYKSSIGASKSGDAATAAISSLSESSSQLNQEQSKLNSLVSRLNSANEQLAALSSTSPVQVAATKNNNNDEYMALRNANKTLLQQLAQRGGTDADIQAKIDANQKKMTALSTSNPSATTNNPVSNTQKIADQKDALTKTKLDLEADISASKDNIKLYQNQVDEFKRIAFSGGGKEVVLNGLQTEYDNAQKELEKYNTTLFASQDLDVNPDFNFRQTLIGQPPIKPLPAHRTLVVSMSAIAMLFIASLILIIIELLDTTLRTPSIFQKETKLKLLSVVNKIDLNKTPIKECFNLSAEIVHDKDSSIFIENLRKLRFELENSGKKIILVTSMKPQVGKTTILEALAYTFSMSKKKVLLIDTNFSNNSLTQRFGAKPTLENFSLGVQDNAIDKIWGITTLTDIINTDIIGCNQGNYTPSEVLPKNNLLVNLNKISQHYDFILMEGAALMDHADSKELSKYAEGIVTVFSASNNMGEIDRESIQFLKSNTGNRFIGAVLNKVNEDQMDL